jgi:hypothetical protein
MPCPNCGESLSGDGYTQVRHCPYADEDRVAIAEPDANPIYCTEEFPMPLPSLPSNRPSHHRCWHWTVFGLILGILLVLTCLPEALP